MSSQSYVKVTLFGDATRNPTLWDLLTISMSPIRHENSNNLLNFSLLVMRLLHFSRVVKSTCTTERLLFFFVIHSPNKRISFRSFLSLSIQYNIFCLYLSYQFSSFTFMITMKLISSIYTSLFCFTQRKPLMPSIKKQIENDIILCSKKRYLVIGYAYAASSYESLVCYGLF